MKHVHQLKNAALLVVALALIGGCNRNNGPISPKEPATSADNLSLQKKSDDHDDDDDGEDEKGAIVAEARIEPTTGNTVNGQVKFVQKKGRVHITAKINGLTPGKHGFHIHQIGDCGNNGLAAGGHFNPNVAPHGSPDGDAEHRHAGDLGNLEADKHGKAHYNSFDDILELDGPNSILNRSVIIHANADDLATQPTGNAGGRIGCGVIEQIK